MQLPPDAPSTGTPASACAVHAAGRKNGRPNPDVNWAIATLSLSAICLARPNIEELTAGRVGKTIARFDQSLGRDTSRARTRGAQCPDLDLTPIHALAHSHAGSEHRGRSRRFISRLPFFAFSKSAFRPALRRSPGWAVLGLLSRLGSQGNRIIQMAGVRCAAGVRNLPISSVTSIRRARKLSGDKLPSAAIVHGRSAHFGERISGPQLGKRPTLPVGFRTFMQNANLRGRPGSPGTRGEGQHRKEDQ